MQTSSMRNGSSRVLVGGLAFLAVLGGLFAFTLVRSQANERHETERRFQERAQVSAALTESVLTTIVGLQAEENARRYGGAVSTETMDRAQRRGSSAYMALVGRDGEILATTSNLRGRADAISPRASHVRAALSGQLGISELRQRPGAPAVFEFVTPIRGEEGARALVSGVPRRRMSTFFGDFLAKSVPHEGKRVYLLDTGGHLVAATAGPRGSARRPSAQLLEVLESDSGYGSLEGGGDERVYAKARLADLPWTVVLTDRRSRLFASASGLNHWLPWLLFAAFGVAGLAALALVVRVARGSRELEARAGELAEAQALAHIGSWEWGIAEDRIAWSDELYRIYGIEREAFEGSYENFLDLNHPDDREAVSSAVDAAYASGEPFSFVHRIVRPDGEVRELHARGRVIAAPGGRPSRMVGTCQDITGRMRAERGFRSLIEAAPDGIVGVDGDGAIVLVNQRTEEMFGYDRQELVGQPVEVLVPDAVRKAHERHRSRYARSPSQRPMGESLELSGRRKDGSEFPVEISLSPVDVDGAPQVLALVRDVSVRRRMEAELRRSEERYRTIVDAAQEGVWIVDADDRTVFVNSKMADMLGVDAEGVIGRSPDDFTDGHGAGDTPSGVGHGRSGLAERTDARFVRPDGEELWTMISGTPLHDDEGRYAGTLAMVADITERKRAERALSEAELRFRRAFEDAPIGIALLATGADAGSILRVNAALASIAGHEPAELVGRRIQDLTLAASPGQLDSLLDGTSDRAFGERLWRAADGSEAWVAMSASVIRSEDGLPLHVIAQFEDISERKRAERRLRHLADHDALTGLYNRRRFEDALRHELAVSRRYGEAFAVLLMDLDNFKDINDTLGHRVGDELIRSVASILRAGLRESDVLARMGGDEFAIILPRTGGDGALKVAGDLVDAVRAESGAAGDGRVMGVTTSVGVTIVTQDRASTEESPLVEADIAMYEAKRAGRDRVKLYAPSSAEQARMHERLTWSERIRGALAGNGFVLHAQPIVDINTMAVDRFELLIRMRDPDGSLVLPGSFLHVAERSGLAEEIDLWVAQRALDLVASYGEAGAALSVAVNLSAQSVGSPRLLETVRAGVAELGTPPGSITFELTETAAIGNLDRAGRFLQELGLLGCSLALDDFGSGFASFSYLKHFPIDVLKIDGEFIRRLADDEADQVMVRGLIETANGLGKRTVAEWVSDPRAIALLRRFGATHAQGNLIAPPIPVEELSPEAVAMAGEGLDGANVLEAEWIGSAARALGAASSSSQ